MMSFIWHKEKDLYIQFSLKLTKVSVYYVIKWKYALNFVHHFLFVYSAWSARKIENIETARGSAKISVARRGEFSRFVGFLAQKGGQIFEDGDLWD